MRKADKNMDNKMSPKELKSFLQDINIEVDDGYAKTLFEVFIWIILRIWPAVKLVNGIEANTSGSQSLLL